MKAKILPNTIAQKLLLLVAFLAMILPAGFAQEVTIFTDKDDYYPGEWVVITGSGWAADDSVLINLTHIEPNIPNHTHDPWYLYPDVNGEIYDEWFVFDEELGTTFWLTATGTTTGLFAEATFTDAINLTMTVGSQTGTLTQGTAGSVTYANSIKSSGNTSTITVNISVSGLPLGVTYTPTSVSVPKNSTVYYTLTLTSSAATPAGINTFTVTGSGTDINSESASGVLTINDICTPPSAPTSGGNQTVCSTSPIQTLTATATAPAGATVVWYNASTGGSIVASPTLSAVGTVTYYAESQNGPTCVSASRTPVTLTINQSPSANLTPNNIGICQGESATLSIELIGTGTISGTLSDGTPFSGAAGTTTTVNVAPTTSTVYTIATLTNGTCPGTGSGSTNVTIQGKYQVNAGADQTICPGATASVSGTITQGTPDATLWTSSGSGSFAEASLLSTVYTPSAADITAGSVILTLTATGTGVCDGSDNLVLTFYDLPNNTSSGFSGNIICVGEPGQLTFDALNSSFVTPYTIEYTDGITTWSQPISDASATSFDVAVPPTVTTGYSLVSVTNGNGCVRDADFGDATAQITVNELPVCSITGSDGPVCPSSTGLVYEAPAGMSSYMWSITGNGTISGPTDQQTVTVEAGADCGSSFTLTLDITNGDGCSSTCEKIVNVVDNTAPTFTRPADIEIFTDASCNYDASLAATGDVTNEADNCSTGIEATYEDEVADGTCEGTHIITRTWSLVDNCGNAAADQVQTITVSDNTAPTFTRPADIEIFTDASCNYDASLAATGDVTNEADNCSTGIEATYEDEVADGTCEGTHIITRTWSLVDNCGNAAADQVQTITVSDNTAPTFTRPADIEIFTDASCNYDASLAATGDVTNEADNCSTGIEATYEDEVADGTCEGTHIITRTWSLVDNCGNAAADQVQTITVSDNTAPTFTRPADIEIFTDASCNYDASLAATGDVTNEADNCSTGIEATYEDEVADGTCEGTHIITRTWSLVDNCGNAAADQVQTITVSDNTAPTFTRPADIEIFTDASCNYDASLAATGDVTNEADNCSTGIEATYEDEVADGTCEGTHIITRTWSLVDNCGNAAADQVQTITVSDNTAPTFTRPADIEIFTDASCNYDASLAATGDVTNEADNCSTGIEATYEDEVADGTCEGTHIITRTWSLVDNCGNAAADQVQTITVSDNTAPTFTRPADIEIFTDASCNYDASLAATGDVTNEADNCSTGIEATYEDEVADGTCEGTHIITRTWSLVDNCGNAAADQVQTITVSDNTAPTFTRPADIEIFTDASCNYDASLAATGDVTNEADNCSTGIEATYEDEVADGTCEGTHIITRTWSLVDNCGNAAADQVQTITVSDNTAPTFTRPADIEIFTDASCNYDASLAATGDVTNEADNCSTGIEATYEDEVADGTCEGTHIITRTWSLVDNCGNAAADQVQTITVSDNTAPTFTRPADIEIFTDASCNYDASLAATGDVTNEADNCSTGIEATYEDEVADGTCEGTHIITRTWSLVDNCGNAAADQVQTITVSDNTAPTFTRPADIEIFTDASCNYDASLAATGDVTNEADNCSTGIEATYEDEVADGTCEGTHIITRTWSLVDNCGNAAADQVQTITVSDNTAPTFTRPADIEIFTDASCNYDASLAATGDVTNEADNCSTGIEATYEDEVADGTCEGTHIITRTWSLVDNCGNAAADQVQTITVSDNTAPTFTRPADIEIFTDASCNYDASLAATGDVTNEADNCSTGIEATYEDEVADGTCEGTHIITRTWSLVDNCGNAAADQVQTITVSDNTAPTFTRPADIEIFTDASCNYDASLAATGDVTNEADNCSTGIEATYEDEVADGTCEGTHIITRTWSLVDNCGNAAADQVQTITVSDNTPPEWTTSSSELNRSVYCGQFTLLDAAQALAPVATDNCSNVSYVKTSGEFVPGGPNGTGTYTNTWTATDECGNQASTVFTQTITVLDITIDASASSQPVQIGSTAMLSAKVSPAVPGVTVSFYLDEHMEGTAITNASGMATLAVQGLAVDVYMVTAITGDGCSEAIAYLPVYDPNGGFVTGGGWIYSNPGASTQYPLAEGKANFGFNAKYKTGKNNLNEVDGNTEFQFKAGDLNFKSSSHDDMSLVISGAKATYRGVGTVNGKGVHKFMVTAIDGDVSGGGGLDKFRIRIWSDGSSSEVLYDNEMSALENADATTVLGGGSIVIHKPTGKNKAAYIEPDVAAVESPTLTVYPNPFSDRLRFEFASPETVDARIDLYDMNGRLVKTVFDGTIEGNVTNQADFIPQQQVTSTYIYRCTIGNETFTGKVIYKQ